MRAYHFVGDTLRDGRPVPPDGEWLVHDGTVKMCERGLHFSRHPFDALKYAPGNTLCIVEVDDVITELEYIGVCRKRKIVKRIDAESMLREFHRWFEVITNSKHYDCPVLLAHDVAWMCWAAWAVGYADLNELRDKFAEMATLAFEEKEGVK